MPNASFLSSNSPRAFSLLTMFLPGEPVEESALTIKVCATDPREAAASNARRLHHERRPR